MDNTAAPDLSQHTLILVEGDRMLFASEERGIAPLLACLDRFSGYGGRCTLHDRVTGLAAARLAVHGGFVVEVVTRVISLPAKDFLTHHGIRLLSREIVPVIFNRAKTGACPAETIAHKTKDIREMIFLLSRLGNPISS
jgi:iron complex outermembrane receptor protein